MANTVLQDKRGPVWPLGNIVVPTPGNYVSIMSLVDPTSVNAPETPTPGTSGADEYTPRAMTITFQGFKAGGAPPKLAANTGVVYIVRKPISGSGATNDLGVVIAAIRATDPPFVLPFNAQDRNTYNPYEFFIDADTANDGCQVTAYIAG